MIISESQLLKLILILRDTIDIFDTNTFVLDNEGRKNLLIEIFNQQKKEIEEVHEAFSLKENEHMMGFAVCGNYHGTFNGKLVTCGCLE